MPRCCPDQAIPNEFAPCYASVLMHGDDLRTAVEDVECRQGLASCFTARCASCRRNYLLTPDLALFPTPSAHHTHKLALLAHLRAEGVYFVPSSLDS
jgi:hypothetical protein